MDLIVASDNQGKIEEIKAILRGLDIRVLSQKEAGFTDIEVEENGQTLRDNALIKAQALDIDGPVLADDTGLFVDALAGQPGVHTARYAGQGASDEANRAKLLEDLTGVEDRSAHFTSLILVLYQGQVYEAEGICQGRIAEEERGLGGFGYDPVFIPAGYDETFAQLGDAVKNKISHRALALIELRKILEELAHG